MYRLGYIKNTEHHRLNKNNYTYDQHFTQRTMVITTAALQINNRIIILITQEIRSSTGTSKINLAQAYQNILTILNTIKPTLNLHSKKRYNDLSRWFLFWNIAAHLDVNLINELLQNFTIVHHLQYWILMLLSLTRNMVTK